MKIELSGVRKQFGSTVVVRDVDLTIPAGKLVTLLGPSGCGKTTILRIIAGLERPDAGTVSHDGVDVTSTPVRSRNTGFVFQSYALFPHMTVFENIAYGLSIRHRPKTEIAQRVNELLALIQLEPFAERRPHQLSGGQRQRVSLARALAIEPGVLLLDEPFAALDATVRRSLRRWLRRLHEVSNVTTVLVTHDVDEALDVADVVVVMDHGSIEQIGTPAEIRESTNGFVRAFIDPDEFAILVS
ncbi:MAG TPA: ATP-binding cassette domain-containing protein [Candidatus Lustribacter sp.]|nr:ATP-binding cassette domain-containing protein [Candidatus Lustribacter sp.]